MIYTIYHCAGPLFFLNDVGVTLVYQVLRHAIKMTTRVHNNSIIIPEALIYHILTDYTGYSIAHVI